MSSAFNLTAQLNLRGPNNVGQIVADIRRQIGTINGNINFRIDPNVTRNVTQLNGALRTLNTAFTQTQRSATDATNAIRAFSNAVGTLGNTGNIARNITNAANATQRLQQNANTTARDVGRARSEMEEFGRQSALAIRRFAAFSVVTSTVFAFTNAINKGIAAFIDYDKQFVKLQQVTGESANGLKKLSGTITSLSKELGVASSDLTGVASTLAQAGLSAKDTERALKALALSALAPSFDDMNKTVEGSIALMKQFGISAKDLESSLGAVNAVSAKFAVESSDIIAAIQRTGGVFASASKGVSEGKDALNEFIAVFTSVRATTRESAETIATGLRTIFTRIQRGGTIEALKEFGVTLTDVDGKFVGAYKAIQLLSEGLNKIDPRDIKFSQIVEELGGFRQIGKVIPLIQQFATAQEALRTAQQGQGSLAKDAATAQLSLANQISKVREEFLALFREVGSSDSFQTIAKSALNVASALIKVADSVKGVLPVLGIMLAVRGASGITQFGAGFARGIRRGGGGRGAANGGIIKGYKTGGQVNNVPVALMPGEAVVYPEAVKKIGVSNLRKMNYADRQKRAKGGGVGMVPGQGNSDSFYTSLPEGSFVIRKKATEALGYNNISSMAKGRQKFAKGGSPALGDFNALRGSPILDYIRSGNRTIGAAILQAGPKREKSFRILPQTIEKAVGSNLKNLPPLGEFNTIRQGLSDGTYKIFNTALNKGIINGVNSAAGYITRKLGLESKSIEKNQRKSFLSGINDAARGNLFEDILVTLRDSPGPFSERTAQQPFDFPNGLGGTLKNEFADLPSKWVDAKASFKTAKVVGPGSLKNKTIKQITDEIKQDLNYYKDDSIREKDYSKNKQGKGKLDKKNTTDIDDAILKAKIGEYQNQEFQSAKVQDRLKEIDFVGTEESKKDIRKFLGDGKIPTRGLSRKTILQFLGRASGGLVKLAGGGGIPLVDDLPNAPGAMLPMPGVKPGSPLYEIIKNRGGAIDYDRTLQRTVGDAAYAAAKTSQAKEAVLQKYFRDPKARLQDAKTARLTQFGTQLQQLIKKGIIEPKNLSIISKSSRTPGLPEHISQLFGIPPQNMVFTSGGSKIPALEAIRTKGPRVSRVSRASGGEVPILAQEGEYVINRKSARAIGYSNLHSLNKYHSGGKVQKLASGGFTSTLGDNTRSSLGAKGMAIVDSAASKVPAAFGRLVNSTDSFGVSLLSSDPKILASQLKAFARSIEKGKTEADAFDDVIKAGNQATMRLSTASDRAAKRLESEQAGTSTQSRSSRSGLGAGESRDTGSIGSRNATFSNVVGFRGEDISKKALTSKGTLQSSFSDKLSKQAASRLDQLGYTSDTTKKALLIFNTSLKQTGNAQTALSAAIASASKTYSASGSTIGQKINQLGQSMTKSTEGLTLFQKSMQGITKLAGQAGAGIKSLVSSGGGGGGAGLGLGSANTRATARQLRSQGLRGQDLRNAMGGGIGSKLSNAGMGLGFAVPMIAEQFTTADPKTAKQAGTNAMVSGIGTAVGSASMLASMGPLGVAAALPVAVGGIVKAFADAENAANEFSLQMQKNKLEEYIEKAATSIDKFSGNLKDTNLERLAKIDATNVNRQAQIASKETEKPQASMVGNIAKFFGQEQGGQGEFERSKILESKGILSYLGSLGNKDTTAANFESLIPDLAKERAKGFSGAADVSSKFLESQIKSGKTVDSLKASGEFDSLTKSLALADAKLQEQIATIQNSTTATNAQKEALIKNITAAAQDTKAREIETKVIRELALSKLNATVVQLENSLERTFQNMEQAIGANVYALSKLSDQAELTTSSLSGTAKAGSVKLDSINILQNPRAYSEQARTGAISQASSMFGTEAKNMEGVLGLSGKMEETLMSTIRSTLKSSPAGATQEAVGAKVETSINQALSDLQLPPELAIGLSREVKNAVIQMRKNGEDSVDFSQIINQVPQLGKVLDSSKRAYEVALKALEHWQNSLNEYSNAMNQIVDIQIDSNSKLRKSNDILVKGNLDLNKALGKSISLEMSRDVALMGIKSQTGGITNPNDIGRQIQSLEGQRRVQQQDVTLASQKGFAGKDEFIVMQDRLKNTNIALRENYDALKQLADNSDLASAAMDKISEIRQKQQAGVGIAERLVTSNPQELSDLNSAMNRLNNNMKGGINVGTTAEDRRASLDAFNMIAPLLGDKQDTLKANVLEGMLKESGLGINPMMQQVLTSLRNPAADPEMAKAITAFTQGNQLQSEANKELIKLNSLMAAETSDVAAKKLSEAIAGTSIKFENSQLDDINKGIQDLVGLVRANVNAMGGAAQPQAIAAGGPVYAAAGQYINFQKSGTDTVPAMLTPGEFVVNRSATKKNLPLLESINNGYSNGGKVNYYATGGLVFGNGWGKKEKVFAEDKEAEFKYDKQLPALNWDYLNTTGSPIGKQKSLYTMKDLPFYLTSEQPKKLTEPTYSKFTSKYNPFPSSIGDGLKFVPGAGYSSLDLKYTGSGNVNSAVNMDIRKAPKPQPVKLSGLPDENWVNQVIDRPMNKVITPKNIGSLLSLIQNIKNNLPELKYDGSSLELNNLKIALNDIKPRTSPKITTREQSEGWSISNLATTSSNPLALLLNETDKNMYDIGGIGTRGNFIGPQIEGGMIAAVSEIMPISLGAGAAHIWPAFSGRLANSISPIGDFTKSDMSNNGSQYANYFNRINQLKSTLGEAENIIKDPTKKLSETQGSLQNKEFVQRLYGLINGSLFKATFNNDEIQSNFGANPPITLLNMTRNAWKNASDNFGDQNIASYAKKDGSNFISVKDINTNNTIKDFPWVAQGFTNMAALEDNKRQYMETVGELIAIENKNYASADGKMKFPYKTITGPLYDTRRGRFENIKRSFNVIEPGNIDPLNPLAGLALQPTQTVFAGNGNDIDTFALDLMRQFAINKKFSLNIANRLQQNALASLDYGNNTKANAYTNLMSSVKDFDPISYKEQLKKQKEALQKEQVNKMVGGVVMKKASDFDEGKQVSLARFVMDAARKNIKGYKALKIPLRKPNTLDDVQSVVDIFDSMIPNTKSVELQSLAFGYRTVLSKIANGDSQYFQNYGFDIKNAFSGPLTKKIRSIRTGLFEDQVYDYKNIKLSPEFIKAIAERESLGSRFGVLMQPTGEEMNLATGRLKGTQPGALTRGEQQSLKVQNGKLAQIGADGNLSYTDIKDAESIPKNYSDLVKFGLNPYNEFGDTKTRYNIIEKLQEITNKAVFPGTRRPLFDKKSIEYINSGLDTLQNWYYSIQDQLLNTSNTKDTYKQYKDMFPSTKSRVDSARAISQPYNTFFTANSTGELPTSDWLYAALTKRSEEPQKLATGGIVYASTGKLINFQPKGTDTVPAMLTPGEFVINRSATQKHLPLLQSINKNKGGKINYLAAGGISTQSTGTPIKPVEEDRTPKMILNGINTIGLTTKTNLGITKNVQGEVGTINNNLKPILKANGFSHGGVVYANSGTLVPYSPKGTDTVPAMLTPGEFVVNRRSTAKHLPLLKQINSGEYANGGIVYLADGGFPSPNAINVQTNTSESIKNNNKKYKGVPIALRPIMQGIDSRKELYDAITPTAIDEKFGDQKNINDNILKILKKEADNISLAISPEEAKKIYDANKIRYEYLRRISTENKIYYNKFKGSAPAKRFSYDGTKSKPSLVDIFAKQYTNATGEALNEYQPDGPGEITGLIKLWTEIFKYKPDIFAQIKENPVAMSRGGVIYASNGTLVNYQSRGTDTIPAMLTPGEFVINRQATAKHLPLLKAINQNASGYSKGGVAYLSAGGFPSGANAASGSGSSNAANLFGSFISQFSGSMERIFNSVLQRINSPAGTPNGVSSNIDYDALSKFTQNLASVSRTLAGLDKIPSEIKITGRHDVNVVINGDSALNQLAPNLQRIVTDEINKAFQKLKDNNPSLQNSIDIPTST